MATKTKTKTKKRAYYLRMDLPDAPWLPVEGTPVTIEGWDHEAFFVHRNVGGNTPRLWKVSHARSGQGVTAAWPLKVEAIRAFRDFLGRMGADKFALYVKQAEAQSGVAPGYASRSEG